jgi:hypothetical protein
MSATRRTKDTRAVPRSAEGVESEFLPVNRFQVELELSD